MVNFFDHQPAIPHAADAPAWDDDADYGYEDNTAAEPQAAPEAVGEKEGIVPLGHDRGVYYYYSVSTGQVEAVPATQHSRAMLTHLGSEVYHWQRTRFKGDKGIDWHGAADDLMKQCRRIGIFDPDRLRGRGAWLDGGRSVLHLGDQILLDGKPSGLIVPQSRFIYEHSARMDMDLGEPLSDAEANMLRELCCAAPWESPEHMGKLLAGWCVIAPVCGAMPWRPHLWITSEGGGGKSWVLDNIVKKIVGPVALEVQSKTTEAGIRQTLSCDARPVIFDEAETQNDRDRDRVQLVLDLARQASSEAGAAIIKGSANGKAMQYHIRSCFVFSSINVGMSQSADESRTVVLTLAPNPDKDERFKAFDRLKKLHSQTMVPGFSGRLLARTLALLPIIRQNAEIFADAIARAGNSRRMGDTYGVLLAGAWSLRSQHVATVEQADKMVAETKWVKDAVVKAETAPEYEKAFTTLLQHRARILNGNGRSEDIPIGELIRATSGLRVDGVHERDAKISLARMGLGVVGGYLQVANHSSICAEVYSKTPWAASWASTLTRMPGAKKNAGSARLGGTVTKVFTLPMGDLLRDD